MSVETPSSDGSVALPGQRRGLGRFGHVFAALDLGTHNCRLLVAKPTVSGFRVIDAFSRVVRLGEGLGASGALSETAMLRTLSALKICAQKMAQRGVTRARAVGTEACRQAANRAEFLDRAQAQTGIAIEVISSGEEANLALSGCAPLLDYEHSHALVFDIGGGSTELMWLKLERHRAPSLIDCVSLPCGVVSLTERWDPAQDSQRRYEAVVAELSAMLADFEARHGLAAEVARGRVQMLGTSGTVTTLAAVLMDLPRYDRSAVDGRWLDFADAIQVAREIAAMSAEERAAHACIGLDRADLMIAGCAIVDAIFRAWPAAHLRVADRGVREGMLNELMRAADREGRRRPRPRGPHDRPVT